MRLEWNLKDLFKSHEDFYKEIDKVKELLNEIKKYEEVELNENNLLELLDKKWRIKELTNNILVYGSLCYYKNINSEETIKMKSDGEQTLTLVDASLSFIDRKIISLGIEKIIEFISLNKNLETYRLYLNNLFRLQSHIQSEETNEIIKENKDKMNELINKYNSVNKGIEYGEIEIDGKTIELSSQNLAKYLSSRDRETRKNTYLRINETHKNYAHEFSVILDSLIMLRNKNASLEQYNSVLEKVLFEENINVEVVAALIKSVNKYLPIMQKYLELKIKYLDIQEPHLYDLNVPLDQGLKINFPIIEAVNIIKEALSPLGSEYIEVINMLLNGHIDAVLDENKSNMTFSWNEYSFLNYRESYGDLKNFIHELGHIGNYYLSKNKMPYLYEDSTVFVGETASIINEILLNRYLFEKSETMEEKIFYLTKEIENFFTSVFKQTMYTEFEKEIYLHREQEPLTEDYLNEKYLEIIKKYYGNSFVYDESCNIEWTKLGHTIRWSYYSYKYATGLLIASTVVNKLIYEKSLSKEKYLEFLSLGSSKYSLDLLKILDIDLINLNVIEEGFKILEKDIESLEKLLIKRNQN